MASWSFYLWSQLRVRRNGRAPLAKPMGRGLLRCVGFASACLALAAQAATPPGTPIINTATATYGHEGRTLQVQATAAANAASRTPARIDFLLAVNPAGPGAPASSSTPVNAGACFRGGAWQPQSTAQTVYAGALTLPRTVPLTGTQTYLGRDAAFIRVIDPDQNLNPLVAETVEVTVSSGADSERLRLTETGPSTGVFVGWVALSHAPAAVGDCVLSAPPNARLTARYTDPQDATDVCSTTALVDPLGLVFRSDNGQPVDGAQVTLVNDATGQPAQVLGDDGASSYPATVVSGASVTDASGHVYPGVPGRYRFPFVVPGRYRLLVVPPQGLAFPSGVADAQLQTLPNGPYALMAGSRGAAFDVGQAPVQVVDVPLDPRTGALLLTKQASKTRAAPGDFVRYTLTLTNKDRAPVNHATIVDTLPPGLRLQPGTARTGTGDVPVVQTSADGRTLTFVLGTLAAGAQASVSYTALLTVQVPLGAATNTAIATGDGATPSTARATVEVFDDLMASKAILVGTVFVGQCPKEGQDYPAQTLRGARVVMHNGRFAISGADGHWHMEGIDPGTNMVRLDNLSVPNGYRISPCPNGSRGSAQGWAQTLQARPGGIYRVNFFVQPAADAARMAVGAPATSPASATVAPPTPQPSSPPSLPTPPSTPAPAPGPGSQPGVAQGSARSQADPSAAPADDKSPTPPTGTAGTEMETIAAAAASSADSGADPWAAQVSSAGVPAPLSDRLDQTLENNLAGGDANPAWVWPLADAVPNTYSSLLVRHPPGATVALTLNGQPISGFHFEGVQRSADGQVAVSYWRNVHLQYGDNPLLATVTVPGQPPQPLSRVLHVSTAPARAELVPEQSRLIANGRDPVVVAVRLLDKDDQPVRADISGDITLNAPYQMQEVLHGNLVNPLSGGLDASQRITPRYVVGANGVALLKLAPTTQAGSVEVGFRFNNDHTQTLRTHLVPEAREWIVVGFAETSVAGRRLREQMRPLTGYAVDDPSIPGERVALFAKGMVPGEFLMTLAYDSAKPRISPHQDAQSETTTTSPFYTVYADNAQSGNEAPTDGKLYLKLEKHTFQLLWGNFNTGLTRTDLARYDRSVYGLRSAWQGERWSYTAFAFENRSASQLDVVPADGTTGSYRLRRLPVLEQSEQVRIVTRQRLDPTTVRASRTLVRQIDYTLDYASGLLILAQPVPATDIHGNPNSIEIAYESKDAAGGRAIAGGRVALQINPKTEAGLTLIHDGDARLGGQLGALDVQTELAPGLTLRAEAGLSHRRDAQGLRTTTNAAVPAGADHSANGQAISVELKHQDKDTQLRAYARSADAGYGLPDQTTVQPGIRSMGVEWRETLSLTLSSEVSLRQQQATETGQRSRAAEARLNWQSGGWQLGAGLRWAQERAAADAPTHFGQWLASAAYTPPEQRWTLRTSAEMATSHHAALQYPDRIGLAGEYRLTSNVAAIASHEWLRDSQTRTLSQVGARATPWTGGSIQSTLAQTRLLDASNPGAASQTSLRTQLAQSLPLGGGWAMSAQLTHAQRLSGSPYAPRSTNSPLAASPMAAGVDAAANSTASIDAASRFTSAGLGLSYSDAIWSGFARYEKVWADQQHRDSLALGVTRQLERGHNLLLASRIERASDHRSLFNLTLQHAWRAPASPWSWLQRLDWVDNRAGLDNLGDHSRRVVYNTHLNYRSTAGWELGAHLGTKHVFDRWDALPLRSTTLVAGLEGRVDVNDWLDVGLHGVLARSMQAGVRNWGYGLSLGLKPVRNTQIEVGYNWRGITDRDFFANNQRAQGLYVNVRVLFDEGLLGLGKDGAPSAALPARLEKP